MRCVAANLDNEEEEEFIKKWRRDIIKISPVIKINSKGENTLGHTAPFPEEIPEVKDVILDTSVSEDLIDMAKKILRGEM